MHYPTFCFSFGNIFGCLFGCSSINAEYSLFSPFVDALNTSLADSAAENWPFKVAILIELFGFSVWDYDARDKSDAPVVAEVVARLVAQIAQRSACARVSAERSVSCFVFGELRLLHLAQASPNSELFQQSCVFLQPKIARTGIGKARLFFRTLAVEEAHQKKRRSSSFSLMQDPTPRLKAAFFRFVCECVASSQIVILRHGRRGK